MIVPQTSLVDLDLFSSLFLHLNYYIFYFSTYATHTILLGHFFDYSRGTHTGSSLIAPQHPYGFI